MRDLPPCSVCGESLNDETAFSTHVVKAPVAPDQGGGYTGDLCGAVSHERCAWQHASECPTIASLGALPPAAAAAAAPARRRRRATR